MDVVKLDGCVIDSGTDCQIAKQFFELSFAALSNVIVSADVFGISGDSPFQYQSRGNGRPSILHRGRFDRCLVVGFLDDFSGYLQGVSWGQEVAKLDASNLAKQDQW